jgi:hypothetical protein
MGAFAFVLFALRRGREKSWIAPSRQDFLKKNFEEFSPMLIFKG